MKNIIISSFSVPEIIKAMNESNDIKKINQYENMLATMYASFLLLLGAITNIILSIFYLQEGSIDIIVDSAIFLVLIFLFSLNLLAPISVLVKSHTIALLNAICFTFIAIRFYDDIGPAIWTVAALQLVLGVVLTHRVTISMMGIASVIVSIYMWNKYKGMNFELNRIFYIVQVILLLYLFFVSHTVNQINVSRIKKIIKLYSDEVIKKEEITQLYEELSATEEEIREQNQQLLAYNKKIMQHEEKLNYLAFYDDLTDLPNRKMIIERLDLMIKISQITLNPFAVVFIDLDNFKKINDTLGHHIGDLLIKAVSIRLKELVYDEDMVGRMGGDEFALIIQRYIKNEELFLYIEKIRNCLSKEFLLEKIKIKISASIGIAVYPEDGLEAIDLLKCADTSMYKAKDSGKNNIQFFKKEMRDEIVCKIELEDHLRSALENNDFYLVYQPQYCLKENRIRGFEALVRWNTEDTKYVSPMQFIPLAEETGLIIPLGEWILKTACKTYKKLQQQFHLKAYVSVNISAVQIKDIHFIEVVKNALKEAQLEPGCLEIEITESVLIEDLEGSIKKLEELKALGIRIALDDFGIGYSSLSYLKRLPIDTLKIDKSFINDILLSEDNKNIVGAIISLVHQLKLCVVAEGVEYESQLDYLKSESCDCVQGFFFGMPGTEDRMEDMLSLRM